MKAALRPVLELLVVFPGLLLAYFPVRSYLNQSPGRLAARLLPLMAGRVSEADCSASVFSAPRWRRRRSSRWRQR